MEFSSEEIVEWINSTWDGSVWIAPLIMTIP